MDKYVSITSSGRIKYGLDGYISNSFYLKFYAIYSAELLIKEKVEYNDLVPSNQDDTSSEDKEENLPAGGNKKLASKGGILLLLST